MPVARSAPRLLSLVFLISGIFFCCFIVLQEITERQKSHKRSSDSESRKIVAFSLLKQIEIESEEFNCDGKFLTGKLKKEKHEKLPWAQLEGSNVYIYSIYRDRRLYPYEYLRIIAMIKGEWINTFYCQILSSDGNYYITRAKPTKIWSKSWNQNDTTIYYNPFLISCHVPLHMTPYHVSLNTKPCQKGQQIFKITSKNILPLEKNQNPFTICVKPLNFQKDISTHLLQWIIINKILGATVIEFYIESLPKKTVEILEALQKVQNGVILHKHNHLNEINSLLNEDTRIWQRRRYEIITYNDCLYRNIHTSHFVVPIDIDEIIIPRHVSTWAELLHEPLIKDDDNFASYTVRNTYYLRQFNVVKKKSKNHQVFFLRDVIRSDFSSERESGKSFISTKNTLTVFNHYALRMLKPGIGRNKFLKKESVQMNHYKDTCDIVLLPECAKYLSSPVRVVDNVIFKYKKLFYEKYKEVVMFLNRTLTSKVQLII